MSDETGHEKDQRSARRAAAKRLHPDVGGDAGAFDRAMRSFEVVSRSPSSPSGSPAGGANDAPTATRPAAVTVRRTRRASLTKTLRATGAAVADVRRRLPRSFPGSRRYGRL